MFSAIDINFIHGRYFIFTLIIYITKLGKMSWGFFVIRLLNLLIQCILLKLSIIKYNLCKKSSYYGSCNII